MAGQVFDNARPDGVSKNIGDSAEAIPKVRQRRIKGTGCENSGTKASVRNPIKYVKTWHFSIFNAYRNQSTAMIRVMSSVGRPTDVSTMTMVTNPA